LEEFGNGIRITEVGNPYLRELGRVRKLIGPRKLDFWLNFTRIIIILIIRNLIFPLG